jgi:EAL and modified HD-GYP domain-containing signal transduction protein
LQVAADTEPSIPIVVALSCLRRQGYKIALSKFSRGADVNRLLALSDYVKFDVLSTPAEELRGNLQLARDAGAMPIANKVESQAHYQTCRGLGFEYFQGYYRRSRSATVCDTL